MRIPTLCEKCNKPMGQNRDWTVNQVCTSQINNKLTLIYLCNDCLELWKQKNCEERNNET